MLDDPPIGNLCEHRDPRATKVFLFFVGELSIALKFALAVSHERAKQGLGFLRVEVKSIGKIGIHGISPLLAKLTKSLDQSFPILRIPHFEDFDEIKDGKRTLRYPFNSLLDFFFL